MKTAKRVLAVALALLMAFSMFSVAGSASALNPQYTMDELLEGVGTITYGLDVYKVVGDSCTKLTSGTTLQPGDVIEVRVAFGTDFITYQVNTLVFYDTKYFVPYQNGAAKTEKDGKIFTSGFAKTYEDDVPAGTLATDGSSETFYKTLSVAGGLVGAVNSYYANDSMNDRNKYYPTYMREGYDDGATIKNTTPVAAKYADLAYTYASFTAGADSLLEGAFLSSVPYATYYSFRMQVVEGADSDGATTAIFIPALAQRTTKSDARNKLFGGTSDIGTYGGSVRTMYGQGIDATKGEFEAVIGKIAHTHTWDDGVETTPATCEGTGVKTFTCSDCGETYTETIPALGHDYDDGEITTPATCEGEGVKTFTCKRDASHTYTEAVPALGHDYDDGVETTPPTCGKDGVKTFTCRNDASHTYTEVIPATGNHSWNDGEITTPATCRDGIKTFTCLTCGTTREETIPGTGEHQYDEEVTTPASCETAGVKTFTCKNCGQSYTEPIPALGHDWDMSDLKNSCSLSEDYTEATLKMYCKRDASHEYTKTVMTTITEVGEATCTLTGKVNVYALFQDDAEGLNYQYLVAKDTPALGHDYVVTVVPATCTEGGYTLHKCSRCTDEFTTDETQALGHDYDDGVVTTPATCEADGVKTFTCKNDASHTYTEVIPALGHDYDDGVITTPATCTADGVKTFTCKNDASHTYTEVVPALGHDYVVTVVPATCTESGYTLHKCSRCTDEFTTDETPALGHDYDATVVPATCTEQGYTEYVCKNDASHTYRDSYTDALGHAWDDGVVTKEPTEKEEGVKTFTCTRCTETKTEVIEKLPVTELILTESVNGTEGTSVSVTVPYSRKGAVALKLTASEDVTYTSSNPKLLSVDAEGNVRFVRLNIFRTNAKITAKTADGKEAVCDVNIKIEWWQYLVWLIFGGLWF